MVAVDSLATLLERFALQLQVKPGFVGFITQQTLTKGVTHRHSLHSHTLFQGSRTPNSFQVNRQGQKSPTNNQKVLVIK